MKIAVASGKGGTGKTTIATNLAWFLAGRGERVRYIDCDVEEPNGHLFLKPEISGRAAAVIPVPVIDESRCTACGECVRFCQYKAMVRLGTVVMTFPELCHGCGGCTLACPQHAIAEHSREIGNVETGKSGMIDFVHGTLSVGEAMSPPLIRKVVGTASSDEVAVIDAPPGTSCPVITSIRKTDFIVLVTEPTPFGLNDLGLALEMVHELGIPHGVVVNRADEGSGAADTWCSEKNVRVLARIPDDRKIAQRYSRGELIITSVPGIEEIFDELWRSVQRIAAS